MRFAIAAGVFAFCLLIFTLCPESVRAQAYDTLDPALEAVDSIDDGFASLHKQMLRQSPRLDEDQDI